MFNWLRRRRLSAAARKKLLIVAARSEEALVETHVANIIDLLDTLEGEVDFDRGIEIYVEMMSLNEALAATISNRALARIESPRTGGREDRRFRNVFRE